MTQSWNVPVRGAAQFWRHDDGKVSAAVTLTQAPRDDVVRVAREFLEAAGYPADAVGEALASLDR